MLPTDPAESAVSCQPVKASGFVVLIRRLMRQAEIDNAVVFGILTKIWGSGSGVVTMLLIASHFTPELQGYYYTFSSLLALQVFVELGLGTVIIQFASHEWSKLGLDEHRRIVGVPEALSRLVSLGRVALKWYIIGGGLAAVGLGWAGYIFFSQSPQHGIEWMAPWFALCALSGINLCLVPVWSLLEGCNQVSQVYAYRLIGGILGSLSVWLAIALGAGLWTGVLASAVSLTWSGVFLYRRYRQFLKAFFSAPHGPRISWRSELLPMQWRIALSWISGYFIFSLFTPVSFHYHGAIVAGQMGMSWALVSALGAISSTWSLTKAPRFGILIARKEYANLDRLFLRVTLVSSCVALCGAGAIWTLVYLLYAFDHPLSARLLPPLPTGLFLLATILMQISVPQAIYLRAHKKEPFLVLSLVQGVLTGLSVWLLGSRFGATGMAAGYLAVVAVVVLPMGTIIWYRRRATWHAPMGEPGTLTEVNDR